MQYSTYNKRKIINDPVHGFITIPNELIFDLIEHPYFQRLRRIKQLGLSHLVYPGANHTRFHHAIGAMHLMDKAIDVLRSKEVEISDDERIAALIAILLHDIGHGPFSHTLESALLRGVSHEEMSLIFMQRLNAEFNGKLDLSISIFSDKYPKKFLHQLVSSQLDMDRLDYLQRDSFFTGVSEGIIGSERIITMLNVVNGGLAVESKGIYSIENFISARRIMYWQVYMHKTVVSSEYMLTNILSRARELFSNGADLFATPQLKVFLDATIRPDELKSNHDLLDQFARIDDNDIISAVKVWQDHDDIVLSTLCTHLISRRLFKTEIAAKPFSKTSIAEKKKIIEKTLNIKPEEANYFVRSERLVNNAYNENFKQIHIVYKDGRVSDIAKASDNLNISALAKPVEKFSLCYLRLNNKEA